MGNSTCWPYLMSLSVVPAVLQCLILPCCPSSPRYLLIKLNKESLARQGIFAPHLFHIKIIAHYLFLY